MGFFQFRLFPIATLAAATVCAGDASAKESPTPEELAQIERLKEAKAKWEKADRPGPESDITEAVIDAAVSADRPEVVENVLARGKLKSLRIPVGRGGKAATLRVVRDFPGIETTLADELLQGDWVARRITKDRLEVWTPTHGWLLDGAGTLIAEAKVFRQGGTGREWHGAFLPDGRWITTQISENDSTLSFFSAKGELSRILKCSDLATRDPDDGVDLIGWARSDKDGRGWVVNVGSEYGYATVWVGPEGPARVLKGAERWQLCYPRALGPRGTCWTMNVPDDAGARMITRREAGHGQWVGYPNYSLGSIDGNDDRRDGDHTYLRSLSIVPNGEYVFGFWPGGTGMFAGSTRYVDDDSKRLESRKYTYSQEATETGTRWKRGNPIEDKTWFFNPDGQCTGWLAGRRIGDAADGKSMLFRLTADSRVAVLKPDLTVSSIRRLRWKDDAIADALILWDDLRCGLFVRDRKLILATW